MTDIEKLQKLKLQQPKGLRQFIWNKTDYKNNGFGLFGIIETIEEWNGTLLLRCFAFKRRRAGERTYNNIIIKEVERALMGNKKRLVCDCYSYMSGRQIEWDSDDWNIVDKNWKFYGYKMYDEQEIIKSQNAEHCGWEEVNHYDMRLLEYLALYKANPKLELLIKRGMPQYVTSLRYLDTSKTRIEDIFKVTKNQAYMIPNIRMSDVLILRRWKDIKEYSLLNIASSLDGIYVKKYITDVKGLRYIEENMDTRQISIYDDYLRFAEELGLDLSRNKYLYPTDMIDEHDKLMNRHKEIVAKENAEKFEQQFEKYKHLFYESGNLIIKPVETQEELNQEGKALNHCVSSYAKYIANGSLEIMVIRKKENEDEPYITLELKNNKVEQVRGMRNCSPNTEVKEFIKAWSKENQIRCDYILKEN